MADDEPGDEPLVISAGAWRMVRVVDGVFEFFAVCRCTWETAKDSDREVVDAAMAGHLRTAHPEGEYIGVSDL